MFFKSSADKFLVFNRRRLKIIIIKILLNLIKFNAFNLILFN